MPGQRMKTAESDFMKKAQRRPVMRTKMRNLRTGQVVSKTFKQGDSAEEADIAKAKAQYLYMTGNEYTFMNQENYEQYSLSKEQLGDAVRYLQEGMELEILLFENNPVSVKLPIKVEMKVVQAAPGIRGDSASNIMKEVVVEGGSRMQAPLFIKEGDIIRVDTRSGEYVERVGN